MSRRALRKAEQKANHRDSVFSARSLDEANRTIEVVAATETPVVRWHGDEVLRCTSEAIVTTRLKGLPVIDSHDRSSVLSVLGQVTDYRIANRQLIATVKFADSERGRQAFDLVKEGMLNKVSVGYVIRKAKETDARNGSVLLTATEWEPYELSLVSVPADPNATVRGASDMRNKNRRPALIRTEEDDQLLDTRADDETEEDGRENNRSASFNRQLDQLRDQAVSSGLLADAVDSEFETVRTISGARDRVFKMLADRVDATVTSPARGAARSQIEAIERQATDVLASRFGAAVDTANNPLAGLRTLEIIERFFQAQGVNTRGVSDIDLADAALGDQRALRTLSSRAAHTTSDFAFILENAASQAMIARFRSTPPPLKALALKRNVQDFRPSKFIRPGEAPALQPILEDGEIKFGTVNYEDNGISIQSFGRAIALSRQLLINDALGVISDAIAGFSDAANDTEGNMLFQLLSANSFGGVKLSDGKNLFHADHGNLAAAGSALGVGSVSVARTAMRLQKNVSGNGTAGVVPAVLVVGPQLETSAQQFVTEINATTVTDANPFAGKLSVAVENRYTGSGWWLFGDPASRPALMYGYLDGFEGPRMRMEDPFGRQGRAYSCELDFGCAVYDRRAAYFNPGV
ncbi:hypothetical protein ASC97_01260 [Rhizobium sp. Root1203]|uniref:phage major capsid protein n=1 Tax=Rhizobium sp. Root1203 TaxID=1736427 RepID=UPI000708E4BA|nr:HK97 family phage prohead protease [Rhizobium sp. Root1203]KQV32254.1 hypothetical protein ASC97_01260 [Rhizobium sp. Root1203]